MAPRYTAFASAIGDPEGTRVVTSIVALLIALGLALAMLAVWLYKSTRPDPELLAPLEVMGERKWRRADPVWQRRRLDALRPPDAAPLTPSAAPPVIDVAFDAGPSAPGFDDLADVGSALYDEGPPVPMKPPDAEAPTPQQIERPAHEEFGDLDPELIERADADLDALIDSSAGSGDQGTPDAAAE